MCLVVKDYKKPIPKKNGRVTVYKVLCIYNSINELATPFRYEEVKPGWLKAEGKLDTRCDYSTYYKKHIHGGAIHAYSDIAKARTVKNKYSADPRIIVECEAFVKDFIANGCNRDVVYKKIFISKRAIKKALDEYRARNNTKTSLSAA